MLSHDSAFLLAACASDALSCSIREFDSKQRWRKQSSDVFFPDSEKSSGNEANHIGSPCSVQVQFISHSWLALAKQLDHA